MTTFAADCFEAGSFTVLSVVLKTSATGYEVFKDKSIESLEKLGFTNEAISELFSLKNNNQANKLRDALRCDFPILIEKSLGYVGKAYYEVGFECGILFLALIDNQEKIITDSVRELKYKAAAAKNPQPLIAFIDSAELKLKEGKKLDISELAAVIEKLYLWIVANVNIERQKSLAEVVISTSLEELPYVGRILKGVYEYELQKNTKIIKPR
jgi:hypothetical protein